MWAEGARLALAFVFGLAIVEKAGVLKAAGAAWHPVMLSSPWRRAHAEALMATSLAADATVVIALLAAPLAGALLALGLLVAYTFAVVGSHVTDDSCRCLWRVLNSATPAGLVSRNLLIAAFALVILTMPRTFGTLGIAVAISSVFLVAVVTKSADRWSMRRQEHRGPRDVRRLSMGTEEVLTRRSQVGG